MKIICMQLYDIIRFTHLYFKMAVVQGSSRKWHTDSLVPETKMADIDKLISLENLLVRKFTEFVLPTTSAPLILSRAFGTDHMTRISHIYSKLTITHSLTFWLPETACLCWLVTHSSIHATWMFIYSATFFFSVLPFRLDLFQSRAQPQTFCQIPKTSMGENTSS